MERRVELGALLRCFSMDLFAPKIASRRTGRRWPEVGSAG